ncbi:sensor histidine kinase [Dokdonella sp. MW10]|uniref:sensor histidine kinase n=1 Tax=Dokdonella sp. MW10 TaxID=2992926 RepID=UPI003F7FAFDF
MTPERVPSLRGLLLRRLWLPLLLLMVASAIASYALARHYAEKVYDRWLWDSAMSLATLVHHDDAGRAHLEIAPPTLRMFEWDTIDRIHGTVESAGGTLFGSVEIPPPTRVDADEDARVFYDAVVDGERARIVQVAVARGDAAQEAVTVRVAETLRKREALAGQLLVSSIPLQLLVLVIAGALVWSGVGAGVRAANRAARRLAEHDASRLVPVDVLGDSPRELWPLAHALNDLVARLAAAQDAQQRFVANAAHQLRTPLAALQVQLERSMREPEGHARDAALAHVLDGVTRLRHVTHQILMLNRSEASAEVALEMREVDLAAIARDVLDDYTDAALARDVDLGYEGPEHARLPRGEPQLLRELVTNLVDNALRYGRRGGVVTLRVGDAPHVVVIDDDGPGIPEAEREQVFERFWRRDGAPGDGCGLGLAIAREIAARHHAGITISTAPGGGARVGVHFAGT